MWQALRCLLPGCEFSISFVLTTDICSGSPRSFRAAASPNLRRLSGPLAQPQKILTHVFGPTTLRNDPPRQQARAWTGWWVLRSLTVRPGHLLLEVWATGFLTLAGKAIVPAPVLNRMVDSKSCFVLLCFPFRSWIYLGTLTKSASAVTKSPASYFFGNIALEAQLLDLSDV